MMTGRYPIADERRKVDLAWQRKREQFLENGNEPRPLDWKSVGLISGFFVVTWGLATWGGLAPLIPAISAATIVSFASLRFSSFERAYEEYRQARARATVLVS
jgi:CHASE2 domain-containing sensor protein